MTNAAVRPKLWTFSEIKSLLLRAYADFNEDQAPRLGAALAYYTALSLAPLLILLIAIAGIVLGREASQGHLFNEIRGMVGPEGAKAIEEMVHNASKPASGIVASLIGLVTLLFGASSVASELRTSLNAIWDQPQDPNEGLKEIVKHRSYALAIVLASGFLLLVSLVLSSFVSAAGTYATGWLPFSEPVLQALNMLLSLAVVTVVFAFLFKYLPDVEIRWRDVLLGAVVTAILFTFGKFLIGMYLGKASFGSTYGAAGSLVIVLVWVYYSSQILFFGAEFTQVYACEHGSDPRLCGRHDRRIAGQPKQATKPIKTPAPTRDYAQTAAGGNAVLDSGTANAPRKGAGLTGILLGGFLAGSRIKKALRWG